MNKRDQAIADVNAATAADNGVIKNQPLLYLYAVEQREAVIYLRQAVSDFEAICIDERYKAQARAALKATA